MMQLMLLLAAIISTTVADICPAETQRIINGVNATLAQFPYIVSLRFNLNHDCGGTILDKYNVLTAAHCVIGSDPESLTIQYGVTFISNDTKNSINVSKVYLHNKFAPALSLANDVAVLKLETPIPLSTTVQTVTLPNYQEPVPVHSRARMAGWGIRKSGVFQASKRLQKMAAVVYTNSECVKETCYVAEPKYVLCAGLPKKKKGPCLGDSGGPLVIGNKIIGITSWNVPPCAMGNPTAFAKVARYVRWIKKTMSKP